MRETKFRAWDKQKRQMIGNWLTHICPSDGVVVIVEYTPNHSGGYDPKSCRQLTNPEVDNLELMQFTGLKDKNGKEIYEGDVVRAAERTEFHGMMTSEFGEIEYADNVGAFGITIRRDESYSDTWSLEHFILTEFEVIGNIYENPELLKGRERE